VVRGARCVVRGAWSAVRGALCVVRGARCVERDKVWKAGLKHKVIQTGIMMMLFLMCEPGVGKGAKVAFWVRLRVMLYYRI